MVTKGTKTVTAERLRVKWRALRFHSKLALGYMIEKGKTMVQ